LDLSDPSLEALVRFRDAALGFSSLHAALIALLRQSPVPAILVEAKVCLKASEKRALAQARLFPEPAGEPILRAFTTAHNPEAVRRKFYIHRWMRVPERSVIHRVHDGALALEHSLTEENLSWWQSQGQHLPNQRVAVEAMNAGKGRVLALVRRASAR
jgi:hypothetical protein